VTAAVELVGVSRRYGEGDAAVEALRPTDLRIERGEYVSITGRSGAGKSTMLHLLGLLERPSTGSYLLDGVDVSGLDDVARSTLRGQALGFVFQAFHLMPHRTVLDNVAVALMYNRTPRTQRRSRALDALAGVGLSHRVDAYPTTLSGGERQRVAIARALVTRPRLLLADEPTGNLDSGTAEEVLDIVDAVHRQGQTIVVITHDPGVAARAQRTLTMLDGRLSAARTGAGGGGAR